MSTNGGFTLNGTSARSLGILMLRTSQRPVMPSTVDRTLAIPGRNGAWDFGADLGPRPFDLECVLIKRTPAALQQAVITLAGFLLDANGKPKTLELVFDIDPTRTYYVRYSGSLPIDRVVGLGKFTLPLVAFDPYAYADSDAYDDDLLYDTGLDYDDGLIYPNPTGFTWLYSEQHSSLYNHSTISTGITITITGTASGIAITHEQSGSVFNPPDIAGEVLVIDSSKLRVTVDEVNALPSVSGDFFLLSPGENGLVFTASSASASVVYNWKHKFM